MTVGSSGVGCRGWRVGCRAGCYMYMYIFEYYTKLSKYNCVVSHVEKLKLKS